MRKHSTVNISMDLLVPSAERKVEDYRRQQEEQKTEKTRPHEVRCERWAARRTPHTCTTEAATFLCRVRDVPPGPWQRARGRYGRPITYNCLLCNKRGHFFRSRAGVDAVTQGLLEEPYEKGLAERP